MQLGPSLCFFPAEVDSRQHSRLSDAIEGCNVQVKEVRSHNNESMGGVIVVMILPVPVIETLINLYE